MPGDLFPEPRRFRASGRARGIRFSDSAEVRVVAPEVLERLARWQLEWRDALLMEPGLARKLIDRLGMARLMSQALEVLESMGVGFREENYIRSSSADDSLVPVGGAWTFPMVDASGVIVNIQRRFLDDAVGKRGMYGGRMGLFVPDQWHERPGPILLVEGASDTLALTACGHCAVGRPSNRGGLHDLAALLKNVPEEHEILVVGDNDQRVSDWPGDPRPFAERLATALRREVGWGLPKEGYKDVREEIVNTLGE